MESYLLARCVLRCEMHRLSGAGGGGAGRGSAAGGRVVLPPTVRFPRRTAGGAGLAAAVARRPLRLTVARPPAATSAGSPGPWIEPNDDDTKVRRDARTKGTYVRVGYFN
uniref:Uncharacterized protein n=1 Tax=Oryza brachyantha TaxID=4533 RepID=J3MF39_ORYBR